MDFVYHNFVKFLTKSRNTEKHLHITHPSEKQQLFTFKEYMWKVMVSEKLNNASGLAKTVKQRNIDK